VVAEHDVEGRFGTWRRINAFSAHAH